MQTFTAPLATSYKIQCWGASGGNSYGWYEYTNTVYGGKGGYCSGWISFPYNLKVYVYVGQSGEGTTSATFNGGGSAANSYECRSGGGATDVRLEEGNIWSEFVSLKSRIIVAAGGGGANHFITGCNGGYAGGLLGQDGFLVLNPEVEYPGDLSVSTGGTQVSGGTGSTGIYGDGKNGTFGTGGEYNVYNMSSYNGFGSGGGGGYYGGGGGSASNGITSSGAGGSSFISGYSGCKAITESSTEDHIVHTNLSNHYSGKVFTNSVMIDGGSVMPSPTGGTETGHTGNGYCIITWQQLPQ